MRSCTAFLIMFLAITSCWICVVPSLDAEEADGAVEAFHRIFLHVAGAAVDLLTAIERDAGSFNSR